MIEFLNHETGDYAGYELIWWLCFDAERDTEWFIEDLYSYRGFLTEC